MCYKTQNVLNKQVDSWIRVETTTQFPHLPKSLTKRHDDIPVHINNRRQLVTEENMFSHLEQGISRRLVQAQDTTALKRANHSNVGGGKTHL